MYDTVPDSVTIFDIVFINQFIKLNQRYTFCYISNLNVYGLTSYSDSRNSKFFEVSGVASGI